MLPTKATIPALLAFTLCISTNRTNSETAWSIQMAPCRDKTSALKVTDFNYVSFTFISVASS